MDDQQCLPTELILNIISRLSPKILCRFKCLSRNFLVLISSDSHFKDLQFTQSLKNPRLLSYYLSISQDSSKCRYKLSQSTMDLTSGQKYDEFILEISKSDRDFASFCQVISCRELVCIFTNLQILVSNPSTHQVFNLRDCREIELNSVGIGYVDSLKEYKVVRLFSAKTNRGYLVYTLKEGSQRCTVFLHKFEVPTHDKFCVAERLPVCVDGVLYWISISGIGMNVIHVYYFNLKDNSYRKIPGPKGGNKMAKLVEMKGFLCIQCGSLRAEGCPIYALKDLKLGLWEHVYRISLPPEIRSVNKCFYMACGYKPMFPPREPQLLGFLPSNGSGGPGFVVAEHIGDETSQVHVVVDGIIKRSVEVKFNIQMCRRLLYYESLFSFQC